MSCACTDFWCKSQKALRKIGCFFVHHRFCCNKNHHREGRKQNTYKHRILVEKTTSGPAIREFFWCLILWKVAPTSYFAPKNWIKTYKRFLNRCKQTQTTTKEPTTKNQSLSFVFDQETLISWTFNSSKLWWPRDGHPRSRQVATFVKGTDSWRTCRIIADCISVICERLVNG